MPRTTREWAAEDRPAAYSAVCIPPCSQMAWPRPSSLRCVPLHSWVAAAKVGLDDEAQLKLRGLGEDHGQKRTRTILLSCRMTPPCSLLALPLELFPPRCRNFVPHATACRTTPQPAIASRSHSWGTAAVVSELRRQTHEHVLLRLISEVRKTRFRSNSLPTQLGSSTFAIDFVPILAVAPITGGTMSAIDDASFSRSVTTKC